MCCCHRPDVACLDATDRSRFFGQRYGKRRRRRFPLTLRALSLTHTQINATETIAGLVGCDEAEVDSVLAFNNCPLGCCKEGKDRRCPCSALCCPCPCLPRPCFDGGDCPNPCPLPCATCDCIGCGWRCGCCGCGCRRRRKKR